jgi:hypothetical protein
MPSLADVPVRDPPAVNGPSPFGRGLVDRGSAALSLRIVTESSGLATLRDDYERLLAATGNELPFSRHEWHVAWCRYFLDANPRIPARPRIYLFFDSAQQCVAIVPMILTRRAFGPVSVCSLDMLGPDPAITEVRMPIVLPGYEARVVALLQQALAGDRSWDWVHWTGIDGELGAALGRAADLDWEAPLLAYVLDLPATWEQFHAGLKRNIRESLRHCYNSLRRDAIAFRLDVARTPDAVPAAIDRFLRLHALRANQSGGPVHKNLFASALIRSFFREVCARLAERDAVRVFEIVIDGAVVASRVGFVQGTGLYLYYSGYDPSWGRYSVMTTTLAEAIKAAIAEGLRTVNLSTGTDVGKTRWGPRPLAFGAAIQVARSPKSRLAYALYRRARALSESPGWTGVLWGRHRRRWI